MINDGERMFIAYEKNNEAFYNQVRPVLDSLVVDQCQDVLTKGIQQRHSTTRTVCIFLSKTNRARISKRVG